VDNIVVKFIIGYVIIISIISFFTMYRDKQLAIKHKWRVPEATLFLLAAALGSIGILLGMKVFRHKTKHIKFILGIPFILVLQLVILYFIGKHFNII
jgi:uncharacterized membrane protein YsdA (DUF1294 family)